MLTRIAILLSLVGALLPTQAGAESERLDWGAIESMSVGQTVYFNAWGGSERINAYIDWAARILSLDYGITLRHVKLADTADAVARVVAEKAAGKTSGGSVDLIWINGENFASMKAQGLLFGPFAEWLPNYRFVDVVGKPTTRIDFTVPVDGFEMPWGMAQLVFLYDTARVEDPPRSMSAFLDWAERNPGRFTYPAPPDFTGSTFLKQALYGVSADPDVLQQPADEASFAAVTAPLWSFLDRLHPQLWRGGREFPQNDQAQRQLLDDGEIDISMSFNPGEASSAIAQGLLPDTVRTYVLDGGTIGNTHFLAIPFNSSAKEAAQVFINFMLSAQAQGRKADIAVWGDPTVLAIDRLGASDRAHFGAAPRPGQVAASAPVILEPHGSWVDPIEREWTRRYGT